MSQKNLLKLVIIAALQYAGVCRAQQVVSYYGQTSGSSAGFELPGFNSNLGTLTQVKLTYFAEVWQSAFLENTSLFALSYSLASTATVALGRIGAGADFVQFSSGMSTSGVLGAFDQRIDFSGGSGATYMQHALLLQEIVDPNKAAYVNAGSMPFGASFAASSLLTSMGNGGFIGGISSTIVTGLRLDYSFVAIPEPASVVTVLGLCALLAALVGRHTGGGPLSLWFRRFRGSV